MKNSVLISFVCYSYEQSQQTTDNEKQEQRCLEGDPVADCGRRSKLGGEL